MEITFADWIEECVPPRKQEFELEEELAIIKYDWISIEFQSSTDENMQGVPFYCAHIAGIDEGKREDYICADLDFFDLDCEVDFYAPNWRDALIEDMQKKLAALVDILGLKYDEPNYTNRTDRRRISMAILDAEEKWEEE
jgi:hypothetical protein